MSELPPSLGSLDKATETALSMLALQKSQEFCKTNDIIGTYIFTILEMQSTMILFPFTKTDIWGFIGMYGDRKFCCINTSICLEQQVFVAAHELYHLWFNGSEELITAVDDPDTVPAELSINERKANRFAAEFLVPESLLKAEIIALHLVVNALEAKDIIRLANSFTVPFRTMTKRLYETHLLSKKDTLTFLSMTHEDINRWRIRLGYGPQEATKRIRMGNLVDLSMDAYTRNLITSDKLEYLLELAGVDAHQMGISESIGGELFPT